MEVPKYIYYFITGIFISWLGAWGVNIVEWIISLSIGSLLENLVFAYARGIVKIIYTFFSMFPYALLVSTGIFWCIMHVRELWLQKVTSIVMGLLLIFLFDPDMKSYLPSFMCDMFLYVQRTCYFKLLGGVSLADFTWSAKMSNLDYTIFDIYIAIAALLGANPKD